MTDHSRHRSLLLIESNTTGTGHLFVLAARALGLRPVLVTARPEKYAYLSQPLAPEVLILPRVDVAEIDEIEEAIRGLHLGAEVAGITSSSEYFIGAAAKLAARFGLAGPDAACVAAARDKSHQRRVLAAGGLPAPEFRVVSSVAEAEVAARAIGFPVVIKPTDGTGSIGVRVCATTVEVRQHAASLLARDGACALVEALIEGPEFSVEMFSGRVVGITRKHLGAPPHFVEVGHDHPAETADAGFMREVVERGTALLGLDWGPVHWELRMRGGLAYVIEVNPRLAGGFIPELVRHAAGIDLIRETLRLVIGEEPWLEPCRRRYASIRFLVVPHAGRLAAADVDQARALNGVVDVMLYRSIGDALAVQGDFRDRIGHVIASADSAGVAAATAARARDAVRIRVQRDEALDPPPVTAVSAAGHGGVA